MANSMFQNPKCVLLAAGREGALSAALQDLSPHIEQVFFVDAFMNDLGLHVLGDIGGRGLCCAFGMMEMLRLIS